ncbi:hypothetical protein FA15DRAFT_580927 [Coprinopsis marcescibilis]|uniref:Snf7-domain-containing protein n=1 Tax=Coprinopsis marcescibilis TaxID=230819 RepID=A0A5C3LAM1_COPMA|nr:hypothetical protein FA15DRAFT_580927 [Coprinopsis marcescibilis]
MSTSTPSTPSSSSLRILSIPPFNQASTTRLQALYSDFTRQKHSNPVSFQANVEWWKNALETVVTYGLQDSNESAGSRVILHANSTLQERVKIPKVGKPLALGTVLTELHSLRSFIPITEFMNLKASIYATSSLPVRLVSYVVGKPLWWALEHAGVVGDEGIFGSSTSERNKSTAWHGDYVLIPSLETVADAIMEAQRDSETTTADALYTWPCFSRTFAHVLDDSFDQIDKQDLKVLLKYLERDRGLVVYDKDVIKFVESDADVEERSITAVDRGVLELKNVVESLAQQLESLQNKIDRCTREASISMKQGRKSIALNHLRLRKQLHELLDKRLNSHATLESTLLTVEAAMEDREIMESYQSSTATLKAILAHPSLQRENIEKTMEALAEANTDAHEVDEAIKVGGDIALGVDANISDAEVEEELEALVQEMAAVKVNDSRSEAEQRLLDLRVPEHTPQTTEAGWKSSKIPVLARQ